jgi:hypothetical protein
MEVSFFVPVKHEGGGDGYGEEGLEEEDGIYVLNKRALIVFLFLKYSQKLLKLIDGFKKES